MNKYFNNISNINKQFTFIRKYFFVENLRSFLLFGDMLSFILSTKILAIFKMLSCFELVLSFNDLHSSKASEYLNKITWNKLRLTFMNDQNNYENKY